MQVADLTELSVAEAAAAVRERRVTAANLLEAFIGRIARKVSVLHEGSILAEGTLEQVQADQRVVEVYLGR